MNRPVDPDIETAKAAMSTLLELQKLAQLRQGPPSAALRKDRLTRCVTLLLSHQDDLVSAIDADFGARSPDMTRFTDIAQAVAPLKSARVHRPNNLAPWGGCPPVFRNLAMASFRFSLSDGIV